MSWRLIRLDAYFLSHTNWVELGTFATPRLATRQAEKMYYERFSPSEMRDIPPDTPYQIDRTLFWLRRPFGVFQSYYTMHNRPYTSKYVVLPMSINDIMSLISRKAIYNATP